MTEFETRPEWRFHKTSAEFDDRRDAQVALAWKMAQIAHRGQIRSTKEAYDNHLAAVYGITTEVMGLDDQVLKVASVLHDIVEDQENPGEEKLAEISELLGMKVHRIDLRLISEVFGEEVAFLVDGVTKFGSHDETLRKVLLSSEVNLKVALIKLADRCHNMSTLSGMTKEKQIEKSRETMNVYVPLAESLGMWTIKNYLEDTAFSYLEPVLYKTVVDQIDADPRLNSQVIEDNRQELKDWLGLQKIDGRVEVRVKSYYEAYKKRQKMIEEGKCPHSNSFADVADLISYRIILDDLDTTNIVLGRLQLDKSERLVGEFDNYIKEPADNGYSAYHVNLMTKVGAVEVAVTTKDREDFNNTGVLSKISRGEDVSDYSRIMVFTPHKKMIFLPPGSTGIDCARAISPRLLARAIGIQIDGGEMVDIRLPVPNASSIHVITDNGRMAADPSWVSSCVTPAAKREIDRQQIYLAHRENVTAGKLHMEKLLKGRGLFCLEDLPQDEYEKAVQALNVDEKMSEVYARMGAGGYEDETILNKLTEAGVVKGEGATRRTSIRISGPDIKGTIAYVTQEIANFGGSLTFSTNRANGKTYEARLVVKNLSEGAERELVNSLSYDRMNRFVQIEVV